MSPKIVIRLSGGLGNQLFQFFAGLKVAEAKKVLTSQIFIDTRFLSNYETKRNFEISFITNLYPGIKTGQPDSLFLAVASRFRLGRVFDCKVGKFELVHSVKHLKRIKFSSEFGVALLDGYFQDKDVLFSEKQRCLIAENLLNSNYQLINSIKLNCQTVGIHIRRGDYVSSKSASKVFRNLPLEYYHAALSLTGGMHRVLVFSDDSELSASFASKIGGFDVRKLNLTLEQEFCLLMSCDHHVIANSTFSWWAAYLGNKPGGQVISPQNWYHNQLRSQANPLLLPHFHLIDV